MKRARRRAAMKAALTCAAVVCVFQLGDPGGLHHHTPAACCQGEAVYREHRGAGAGGQRAGQGNVSLSRSLFSKSPTRLRKAGGRASDRDAPHAPTARSLYECDAIEQRCGTCCHVTTPHCSPIHIECVQKLNRFVLHPCCVADTFVILYFVEIFGWELNYSLKKIRKSRILLRLSA